MKIYMIYLIFDKDNFNRVMSFVPIAFKKYKELDDGRYVTPYAYTASKKLKKKFFKFRDRKKYVVKTWNIPKKDFHNATRFQGIDSMNIVIADLIYDKDKKIEMCMTLHEYIGVTDEISENYEEYVISIFSKKPAFDYCFVNSEKHLHALDALNYTNYYDLCVGGDPMLETDDNIEQRKDDAVQMSSSGLSILYGYPLLSVNNNDTLNAFLTFYSFAL